MWSGGLSGLRPSEAGDLSRDLSSLAYPWKLQRKLAVLQLQADMIDICVNFDS